MNVRGVLFLPLIFICGTVKSQTDSARVAYSLSAGFLYANIWTGRGALQQFTQSHPWSAQIDFGVLRNSRRAWNYCNCYAQNGLSLGYVDFSNSEKLGHAFTITGYAEPYLVVKKRFQLSLRGNAGLAFVNRLYDSLGNRENIFFSTNMSFALGLGINLSWQLNDHFKLKTSAILNHISNGGRKDPNEGINFPGISIALEYGFSNAKLEPRDKEKFYHKPIQLVVHAFGNQRTAWPDKNWAEEKRPVAGLNLGLIKRIGRLNGIGAGGEFYYDGINEIYQQRSGQMLQSTAGAVNIQHYLFFGKLLFGQQLAWFLTDRTGFQKIFFQRYFLEYQVGRNWYAGFTLKAHGDHSDYMAFTTGYFFKL